MNARAGDAGPRSSPVRDCRPGSRRSLLEGVPQRGSLSDRPPIGRVCPDLSNTSALLKLYLPEPGGDELNEVREGRQDVLVSDLAVTEVGSAAARRLQHAILTRLDEGVYHRVELTRDVHRRAEHFLLSLQAAPLRAADALHLALAASGRAASFATFDTRLAAAARASGFSVYPD